MAILYVIKKELVELPNQLHLHDVIYYAFPPFTSFIKPYGHIRVLSNYERK